MNWKCEVVMDLAPLYLDGLASRESQRLVRGHLRHCPECRAYYRQYRPAAGKLRKAIPVPSESGRDYTRLARRMLVRRVLVFTGVISYVGATMCIFTLHYLHTKG